MMYPTFRCAAAVSLLAVHCALPPAVAQVDMRLPVIVDAESTEYDGNASMLHFKGLKLTQGNISIESDDARSAGMDFDDNTWHLSGNVVFDINESHIEADEAALSFADFELQAATIEGDPATFEFRRPDSEETTRARARRLHYDVADGVIEFSGDALITEGGNRIAAESLVYNIRERRVNAASSGGAEDRVKVTFTPPAAEEEAPRAGDGGSDPAKAGDETPPDSTEPPDGGGRE